MPPTAPAYTGPLTLGIDLAKWQGKPPFADLWAAGVRIAYTKCTHGSSGVDETFQDNWKAMRLYRDAGGDRFRQAPYGWFVPKHDPIVQADLLCTTIEKAGYLDTDYPVALDFEEVDPIVRGVMLRDRFLTYKNRVRKNLGRKTITYTAKWYFDVVLVGVDCTELSDDDLWNATYPHLEKIGPLAYQAALDAIGPLTPTIPTCWVNAGKREKCRQFDGNGGLVMPNGVDADFDAWLDDLKACDRWSDSTWERTVDHGGTLDGYAANVLGRADDAERAADSDGTAIVAALDSEPPDTEPGTAQARERRSGSSGRIPAVRLPDDPKVD